MATLTKSAPLVALVAFISLAPAAAQAQDERLRISIAPAMAACAIAKVVHVGPIRCCRWRRNRASR